MRAPGSGPRPEPAAYAAYAGAPAFDGKMRVEHVGEGLDEARARFPAIRDGEVASV